MSIVLLFLHHETIHLCPEHRPLIPLGPLQDL